MYELRNLVAEIFMEYREGLFEMELGRLAYDLLELDAETLIPEHMKDFNMLQQIEVLKCIKEGVSFEPLLRYKFNFRQMAELREFQRHGLNVSCICDPSIPFNVMGLVRKALCNGVNILQINIKQYDHDQLAQIYLCIEHGLDVKAIANPELSADEMSEIRNQMARESALEEKTTEKYRQIHESVFGDKIR